MKQSWIRWTLLGAAMLLTAPLIAQTEGEDVVVDHQQPPADNSGAPPVVNAEGEAYPAPQEEQPPANEPPAAEAPAQEPVVVRPIVPRTRPPRLRPTPAGSRPGGAAAGVMQPPPVNNTGGAVVTPTPLPPGTAPSQPGIGGVAASPANATGGAQSSPAPQGQDALTGETASTPISFKFDRAPLMEVIESLSKLTGKNFQVDPNIAQAEVTIITHDKIPPNLAFEVLESVLATYGFSLISTLDGKLYKITQTQQTTTSEKLVAKEGLDAIPEGFDGYETRFVTIQYADPAELQAALQIIASPNARIDTYLPTKTLIITDTYDGLRRMRDFIRKVDIPGYDTTMEIFTLEYTRAEVIAQQLEQVLVSPDGQRNQRNQQVVRQPPAAAQRTARPVVPGAGGAQIIGSGEETLRMVPDERLNALIVVATEGMMEKVRDLVARLDTPTPYEANNLHVYELLNADAEMVEQALQPLISTSPRRRSGGGGAAATASAQGGAAPAAGGGGGVSPEIQPFERQVQIARYDQTNSLLVVASPQDYKVLEAFIARLDVPQRQVHVDAVVMDVTLNNNYTVAVDAAALGGNDGFGESRTTNLVGLASALQPVANEAGNIVAGPKAALLSGVLGLGRSGGITAGVYRDLEVEVNGQMVKVPFVPLLFQAIETVSDLEVLSQPSLMTVDNEEASISVGQEVPFVTNQRRNVNTGNDNQNNFAFNNFNSITREDVGVKLKVTPQISEGDNVLLEVEIEVSDLDAEQIGDVNLLGPTTNKALVTNKVLVKDGSTAVIAGLIRDTTNRRRNQIPVAGDIPVLGWLFRGKSNNQTKRNMVVLVTPHIVKDHADFERLTDNRVEDYRNEHLQWLMKQRFFKKQKQNFKERRDFRPTIEYSESVVGASGASSFGRGDIKR